MTLLITLIAAIISTIVWYNTKNKTMKIGSLALMYWGASLMWLVDSVVEYIEEGAEIFAPAAEEMANDAYLGVCVVAFGLVIWTISVLVRDPKGKVREALSNK